jgi:DNA-binding LacI/PurR family transcriptional regulator
LIHATPIQPVNEDFFRRASAHLRIAHIGYHSEELPSQSFFLPDLVYAGAVCAAELLSRGCRRVTLATGLPEGHHVPRLIRRGMDPVCAAQGAEVKTVQHGRGVDRAVRKLLEDGAKRGVVLSSWEGVPDDFRALKRRDGCSAVVLAEYPAHELAPGVSGWVFDWRTAVTEALAWVMSDHEGLTHPRTGSSRCCIRIWNSGNHEYSELFVSS